MTLDTAVILAAGYGSRLGNLTNIVPKSMIPVGDKTLLDRCLDILVRHHFKKVYIVTGFGQELIKRHISKRKEKRELELDIEFIFNPDYGSKNNFYSLYIMKEHLKDQNFILLNSDLIFVEDIFGYLMENSSQESVFVIDDIKQLGEEEMKILADNDGYIQQFGKYISPREAKGEYIGVSKISQEAFEAYVQECEELLSQNQFNNYYEDVFTSLLLDKKIKIQSQSTKGQFWMEIDTVDDLKKTWEYVDVLYDGN